MESRILGDREAQSMDLSLRAASEGTRNATTLQGSGLPGAALGFYRVRYHVPRLDSLSGHHELPGRARCGKVGHHQLCLWHLSRFARNTCLFFLQVQETKFGRVPLANRAYVAVRRARSFTSRTRRQGSYASKIRTRSSRSRRLGNSGILPRRFVPEGHREIAGVF